MSIEDRIPKSEEYSHIREYVIIRRGLFEDPKYFFSERLAKKVKTPELKALIKLCECIEKGIDLTTQ